MLISLIALAAATPNAAVGETAMQSVPVMGTATGQDEETMRKALERRGFKVSQNGEKQIATRQESIITYTMLPVPGGRRITSIDARLAPPEVSQFLQDATRILKTPAIHTRGTLQWSPDGLPCRKGRGCIQAQANHVTISDGGLVARSHRLEAFTLERKSAAEEVATRMRTIPKGKILVNGKLVSSLDQNKK